MQKDVEEEDKDKVSSLLNHLLWDLQNTALTLTLVCLQGELPSNEPIRPEIKIPSGSMGNS